MAALPGRLACGTASVLDSEAVTRYIPRNALRMGVEWRPRLSG